jgi:hypothetical protein
VHCQTVSFAGKRDLNMAEIPRCKQKNGPEPQQSMPLQRPIICKPWVPIAAIREILKSSGNRQDWERRMPEPAPKV